MRNFLKIVATIVLLKFCMLIVPTSGFAQMKPVIGLHENVPNVVYLTNVRIIKAPGLVIEKGILFIRDGRIEAVGSGIKAPADAHVIDLKGKTIYPGFIDLFSSFGLEENDNSKAKSVASESYQTRGAVYWNPEVHPQTNAAHELESNKEQADLLRGNGFTTVLTLPAKGIFRGSGALIQLTDDTPNKMIQESNLVQSLSFKKGKIPRIRSTASYPRSTMGSISLIRQVFLDAQWYEQAWTKYRRSPSGRATPPTDLTLEALVPFLNKKRPVITSISNELEIFRAAKIARELDLKMWFMGCGSEYRRIDDLKDLKTKIIIPLNFPPPPIVSSEERALSVNLRDLKYWDVAAENPARLAKAKIDFVLSSTQLTKESAFLKNLRLAVRRGLPEKEALTALTLRPAKWLNMDDQLGSLDKGKIANFFITDGDLFEDNTHILETWVNGKKYPVINVPVTDPRGLWTVTIATQSGEETATLDIDGSIEKQKATITLCNVEVKIKDIKLENGILNLSFTADSSCHSGVTRLTGILTDRQLSGLGIWANGSSFHWKADLINSLNEKTDSTVVNSNRMAEFPVVYPDGAFGMSSAPNQPPSLLIKDATIWTSGPEGIIENADMLIKKGKIFRIGRDLSIPSDTKIIDAAGKHLTPGLIDAHAHIATSGGVNEGTQAITAEVNIRDIIDCDDINIYRQLAGGVTTVCTLHGSSNPIGGTYAVIKLRWGEMPDKMLLSKAKDGIKFALGENVKQSNWSNSVPRYPQTRMGTIEIIEDAFRAAMDYRQEWNMYKTEYKKNKNLISPRKNLRYEKILDILDGKTIIHCHSYRQDESLALMRLAEEMNFKIAVFIHILEGYKIATELKAHGAMATTFSDWWTYKMEAYDAIPYNGAIMHEQGIIVSYDSDSAELARRLNTEAAKAVKYGNVPPNEALKFVTLNAAKQLFLEDQIGSLEPGKDADFVIWSDSPLSTYARCEQTWIDGRKYFDLKDDEQRREKVARERNVLIQKILKIEETKESTNE